MLMMSIRQLKERKKELGYTNEMVAEMSGVPLSTVQKIFCGATRHPRYDTLLALTKALSEYNYDLATYVVQEEAAEYSVEYERQFQEDTNSRWPRQGHYTVQDIRALPDEIRVELTVEILSPSTRRKDFIVKTRKEGRIDLSFACEGFLGGYENEVRDSYYHCDAGVSVASILADGSISACPSIRSKFYQGNIYRDDFWTVC